MASNVNSPTPAETPEEFWNVFNERVQVIREFVSSHSSEQTIDATRKQRLLLQDIQQYATQSAGILVAYDNKRSQEVMDTLSRDLRQIEDKVQPKKTFKFSRATTKSSESAKSVAVPAQALPSAVVSRVPPPPGAVVFSHKENEKVSLTSNPEPDAGGGCQLLIEHCEDCVFTLSFALGSLRLEGLKRCDVYLGPCATSAYLEGLVQCTVFVCTHQLRIHNCQETQVYVRAHSHPILEDCHRMGFAPYTWSYPGVDRDLANCGLQEARYWREVVDFRWHKSDEPSPNWRELAEHERRAPPGCDLQSASKPCDEDDEEL